MKWASSHWEHFNVLHQIHPWHLSHPTHLPHPTHLSHLSHPYRYFFIQARTS
jgi:hypothetical protein